MAHVELERMIASFFSKMTNVFPNETCLALPKAVFQRGGVFGFETSLVRSRVDMKDS